MRITYDDEHYRHRLSAQARKIVNRMIVEGELITLPDGSLMLVPKENTNGSSAQGSEEPHL